MPSGCILAEPIDPEVGGVLLGGASGDSLGAALTLDGALGAALTLGAALALGALDVLDTLDALDALGAFVVVGSPPPHP